MDKKLAIPLILALLLIVALDALNYRNIVLVEDAQLAVAESQDISVTLTRLLSLMQDAETGQRGYLLTGESPYLEPYHESIAELGATLATLQEMVARDADWTERLARLEGAIADKLRELEETIAARGERGLEAAQAIVTTDRGRREMEEIRAVVAEMQAAQRRRLSERLAIADRTDRRTRTFALASLISAFVILVLLGLMWNREAARRKRAAQEIARQRELLHITLLSIGDAMITTDRGGNVLTMNPVAEALTGWPAVDARDRPLEEIFVIINERTREPVPNPVTRCLEAGESVELANHTMLIAKDGTARPIDDSAAPIRDARGGIVGAVLIFRDVTERKRLEDDLRRQAAELSEAARQKDEFLAILAHELRNPLAPIANAVALAELSDDPRTIDKAIAIIRRQSRQLSRLVDDLLNIGRINTGRLELRREVIDLAPIVEHAVEIVRPMIDQREQTLELSGVAPGLTIFGDGVRLAQVIGNLLDNASKYSASRTTIRLDVAMEDGDLVIAVRDEGIGIEQGELARVFDMFSQVESGDKKEGLGIGLALVKRLAILHDGSVEARSAGRDLGSEFVVRIPASGRQQQAPRSAGQAPAAPRRIVVVDDNVDAADTFAALLRTNGHEVRTANNGMEALEVAASTQPEIIFMDIGMPGMNGYETGREIHGSDWGREIAIVALTGWDQERNRRRSEEAGFADHLVKPVSYDKVDRLLREIFHDRPTG